MMSPPVSRSVAVYVRAKFIVLRTLSILLGADVFDRVQCNKKYVSVEYSYKSLLFDLSAFLCIRANVMVFTHPFFEAKRMINLMIRKCTRRYISLRNYF